MKEAPDRVCHHEGMRQEASNWGNMSLTLSRRQRPKVVTTSGIESATLRTRNELTNLPRSFIKFFSLSSYTGFMPAHQTVIQSCGLTKE